jgi:hypothetical protein
MKKQLKIKPLHVVQEVLDAIKDLCASFGYVDTECQALTSSYGDQGAIGAAAGNLAFTDVEVGTTTTQSI